MITSNQERANAIRFLSMDAVEAAASGHPGAPMGMADIAEVLWGGFLKHNPENPMWHDRDRFVLSNGHGSMLIYSLLHLTGYDLSIDDLKNFRQLHSRTAGHPEYGETPGVETTTGPLGQGLSNGVGMAIAEKILAGQFNRDHYDIVDHFTYVFVGDGCLMEGISHEVCSLAGTLGLGKLIVFYDDNGISIDGQVEGWFTDDTPARFKSYGWQVIDNIDGHSAESITQAVEQAQSDLARPSLICCKTIIGYGSPNKAGSSKVHGAALGKDEISAARKHLNWPYEPFAIPENIYQSWDAKAQGVESEQLWQEKMEAYRALYPDLAAEFERRMSGELPQDFAQLAEQYIQQCQSEGQSIASRKSSQNSLDVYGPLLPELLGGSADLAGSNNTLWSGCQPVTGESPNANYIHYGVREFGMTGIMNGLSLHGGFIPYGGTFLVFMEYARNAVRMAALMNLRSVYVYTHDSIGLGEDGPTHQPIEQLTSLRSTPNLTTWRPCDTVESAVAWKSALENDSGPTALILSRQSLAHQDRDAQQLENVSRGAYVLLDCQGTPDAILIATGSEVGLAMEAATQLSANGLNIRVVSMPSCEVFEAQDPNYKEYVLPTSIKNRVAIEAGHVDFWYKYVGLSGRIIGMKSFGASGPADQLYQHFGITINVIIENVISLIESEKSDTAARVA